MRVVKAASRMPSMEREPKTLTLDELNKAREAALYVMSTHSSQDAARIFTEGLKPVFLGGRNCTDSDDSDDDDDGDVFDPEDACRRQLRVSIPKKRDFATAPF